MQWPRSHPAKTGDNQMTIPTKLPVPANRDASSKQKAPDKSTEFKYTQIGSYVASYDFYLGVPLGTISSFLLTLTSEGQEAAPTVLLGVAGIGAAVASLMLTALSVLVSSITPEYARALRKTTSGVRGVTEPFQGVVLLACLSAIFALVAVTVLPTVDSQAWWVLGIIISPALALTFWAILGCVQVAGQLSYHLVVRDRFHANQEAREKLLAKRKVDIDTTVADSRYPSGSIPNGS